MKQTGFATFVALLISLTATLAGAADTASIARGGRLYDNFSLESKNRAPNHPNPAFKTQAVPVSVPDTWRCSQCHGWDYKGNHGIIGVTGLQKTNPAAVLAILKNPNHNYQGLLSETDRVDLANFVTSGQTNMHTLVEMAMRTKPAQSSSDKVFATVCADCHGLDGSRLRQAPPLGDSARQHPYQVLHVVLNGHPGVNMPALRTLGDDPVTKMLSFLQTLPSINVPASIANGGRLYDDWQVHTGGHNQALVHPAYPPKAASANSASETWRCKECHGWDYKGNQGQFASGSHATGIKGIRAMAGTDPEKVLDILRSNTHRYGAVLKHRDLQDLANFVSFGQVDMDEALDPRTGLSRGNATSGADHYRSMCVGCHGLEGRFVAKRPLGSVTRDQPWHSMHTMLNGHPDDLMPALREIDPQVIRDLLAYAQTFK